VEFEFRPLAPSDLPALFALDQRCFPPGIAYSQREIRDALRLAPRGFHLACSAAASLAGFILTLRRADRGHVITIDVAPEFRRHGIGQRLLAAAEDFYRRTGARGMRLEAAVDNQPALAFYSRFGYRVIRTLPRYYSPRLDAVLLHKDWAPGGPAIS
jgi:ribosomal-protein-alanine N-acetyltransferase